MRGERGDLYRDAITIWPAQTAPPSTNAHSRWVASVATPAELLALLDESPEGLEWIEVRGLLDDLELWRAVAQRHDALSLDVLMQDPLEEFSRLYRLVDASHARPIGVTMPVRPGFLKALKLATSIGLPVRLLPGQPVGAALAELDEALSLYLYDPMVDAPVEFFHSVLSHFHGHHPGDLWGILQEEPAMFPRRDEKGHVRVPRTAEVFSEMDTVVTPAGFVERHVTHLLDSGAECALCPWLGMCQGYFKWPDENYSCAAGIIPLFDRLKQAADEMRAALAEKEPMLESTLTS
ncbi:hypothetical protein DES53_11629 [Roseimicrobium gellanilyticum]|uniref:Uncharacterized protein n=1 Tax=Roseimicrobium gellanilyticum TaxID=748857 RepID=A0A366H3N6_9BACT|nr:hypothetical protein [Roseimicrobium gellanilyticum]RBP36590.1 hypothetical protein DES53_11629 [Roseimicrobium gellanilyticum]